VSRSPLAPELLKFPHVVSAREQAILRLDDLSQHQRCGCKGPGAETWLAASGYTVPQAPNGTVVDAAGVVVARLATSEFLIEAVDGGAERVHSTRRQLGSASRLTNVYPVARQDMVVGIQGPGTQTLLRQICSVDFAPLFASSGPTAGPVVLTSMVGVGVVAWPRRTESGSTLRVWLDPSFAHYFWTTLLEVGRGVGALVIGSNT
jgi:sarcosine oxidase, subunit gamma